MYGVVAASPLASSCLLRFPSKSHYGGCSCVPFRSFSSDLAAPRGSRPHRLCSSKLKYPRNRSENFSRFSFKCNSSTNPPGQENETRGVLDAFFLGKALAEALNERIESTVGEFLSTIGRLQAEQQKQVQDFQEEVFERAKRAKEKAAREAMEAQGLIAKSSAESVSTMSNGVASGTTSSAPNSATAEESSSKTSVQPTTENPSTGNDETLLGVSDED